jgi:hypothetical protein
VPEHILATLSPDDAVGLCITLPAFFIYYAFNSSFPPSEIVEK